MVLAAENTPEYHLSTMEELPEKIHVFVQIPIIAGGRIEEPHICWSMDAEIKEKSIPATALKIRMAWSPQILIARWEPHHYEVAKRVQEEHGFDPVTNAAAESLGLPLLDPSDPIECGAFNFCVYRTKHQY
jgi:hypothetical protein